MIETTPILDETIGFDNRHGFRRVFVPARKKEYCIVVFLLTQNRDEHPIGGKSLFGGSVACTFLP